MEYKAQLEELQDSARFDQIAIGGAARGSMEDLKAEFMRNAAELRRLREENEHLRGRLHDESPVEILSRKALPPTATLIEAGGNPKVDLSIDSNVAIVQVVKFPDGTIEKTGALGRLRADIGKSASMFWAVLRQIEFDVLDEDISGYKTHPPITNEEFLPIVQRLLRVHADEGHDAYLVALNNERDTLWEKLGGTDRNGRGSLDHFRPRFNLKCQKTIENVEKRLMQYSH